MAYVDATPEWIYWLDSANCHGWADCSVEDFDVIEVKTIGYVIHETDRALIVSPSLADNETFAQVTAIPTVAIVRRVKLKLTEQGA